MALSILTIPVDSRFINALVFILFDVALFNLFSILLTTIHSTSINHRLIRGHRVRLRQHSLSSFLGGLLSDATPLTYILVLLHLVSIIVLFLLTLGINGRSETFLIPASRQYITRIAANADTDYTTKRLHPPMFSSCVIRINNSISYYPTAFDTEGKVPLHDFFDFRDGDGNRVNIDVHTMLCQANNNLPPMLVVRRCGASIDDCDNLQITRESRLEILPSGNTSRRTQNTVIVFVGQGEIDGPGRLILMHRRVKVISGDGLQEQYDRVICFERPFQGEESGDGKFHYNCVIGRWGMGDDLFTFRFGEMRFEANDEKREAVLDVHAVGTEVEFVMGSAEMEVEWEADKNGEALFADGLSRVGQDFVTGMEYLDGTVSRHVVAGRVKEGLRVIQEDERLVTDVTTAVAVGYMVVAAVTAMGWGAVRCWGARLRSYGALVDVTSFRGMSLMLRRASDGADGDGSLEEGWIEFGVTKKMKGNSVVYHMRAMSGDDAPVHVPVGSVIT